MCSETFAYIPSGRIVEQLVIFYFEIYFYTFHWRRFGFAAAGRQSDVVAD